MTVRCVSVALLLALTLALLSLALTATEARPDREAHLAPGQERLKQESHAHSIVHGKMRRGHTHHIPEQTERVMQKAVPKSCSGIPYDFSTSNYCGAEVPSASTYTVPSAPQGVTLALKSIQLVTRHGDRPPVNILPNGYDVAYPFCSSTQTTGLYANPPPAPQGGPSDEEGRRLEQQPYLTAPGLTNPFGAQLWQGNCATGQLTSQGIQQHITLGQGLRQIYVDQLQLLPGSYNRSETSFYLRSTDVWRTKQSAESLLSGLWPTQALEGADVIPFHSFPLEIETMFANPIACPALAKIQAQQFASPEWKAHLDAPSVWSTIDRVLGVEGLASWHNGYDHYLDNFRTRQCHGLPLPCNPANKSDCITEDIADFVYAQGDWEYAFVQNASPLATQVAQLGIGAFMAVIRDVLRATVEGNASLSTIGTPTFAYYSGHDSTLGAVLGALNVTGMAWPPYASSMIFELWQNTAVEPSPQAFSVRVVYNAQTLKLFAAGCCDELCPYQNVVDYLNTMIPPNINDICQGRAEFKQL